MGKFEVRPNHSILKGMDAGKKKKIDKTIISYINVYKSFTFF